MNMFIVRITIIGLEKPNDLERNPLHARAASALRV
jgi:hypothetical protein